MKYFLSNAFFITLTFNLLAQTEKPLVSKDTIFYKFENGNLVTCKRDIAEGFGIKSPFDTAVYTEKILFLQSQTPMAVYECYDRKFENSKTKVSSNLHFWHGKYMEYYLGGEKRLMCQYKDDKKDGVFKVFHKNGNVKRLETWQKGEWQKGECFDEEGQKIPYCSYQEDAQFKGGITALYQFLGNELKYPKFARKNSIEGTVYVSFTIETDGSLSEIKVLKGVEAHLDDEALRLVRLMPKWKPGKFEGELVRYIFTLPIGFRLE
jgi:TonB family protein